MGIDRQEFFERYNRFPGAGGGQWVKINTRNVTNRLSKLERALGKDGLQRIGERGVEYAEQAIQTAFATQRDPVNNRRWKPRARSDRRNQGKPLLSGLGNGASAAWRIERGRLRVRQIVPPGVWHSSKKTQAALIFIHKYGFTRRLHVGALDGEAPRRVRDYLRETEGGEVNFPKRRSYGISRAKKRELKELALAIAREACTR